MVVLPVETGVCSQTAVRVVLSELGKCAASRKPMLKSLLDSSDFSGTLVERELLLRSECPPYRRGLAAEFGRCGATGRRLLEDELGESAVSKRIVGLDLLVRSDASRDSALADEMETCQRSGKRVLPGELETCSVTRAHVLRTELKRSDLSGRWALRDHLVRLSDFRWALADEAVQCVWLAGWIPKSEAARCELTGQIFAIRLLNGEGQLAALADLLDGVSGSGHPDPDLATQLRQLDPDLAGATALFTVRSPSTLRAVCGEIRSKGWFRTKVRHFGLLLHDTPETIVLVGRGVLGYRDRAGEFVIEEGLVFGEE